MKGNKQAGKGQRSTIKTRISGETLRLVERVIKRTGETHSQAVARMIEAVYNDRRARFTVDHAEPGSVRINENAIAAAERIESGKARLATPEELERFGLSRAI